MAFRSDITFNMQQSPRVITVQAPSTELTIQDLHDTATDFEDTLEGSEYPNLISTAGKEALGGGVSVGLTATLQNAQVAFEIRTTVNESGTVTTPDTAGTTLIDSAATFQTNNVARGDLVLNEADGSRANVLSVDSETQLTCQPLAGGVDNQFDSADAYKVFDYEQCQILGGNLVAIDDVGADLDPVFVTFGTQVVRTSSSSATLQELSAIQFSSFNGGVTIDVGNTTGNATSGTTFPTGTLEQPSDNITDTLAILSNVGLDRVFVLGDLTIDSGTWDGVSLVGESQGKTTITVDAAASVVDTEVESATVTGTFDGPTNFKNCLLSTVTNINGFAENCVLDGTLTLGGGLDMHFLDCWSGVIGASTVVINMGGYGQGLAVRNYNGGMTIQNKTGSENVSLDFGAGSIILQATVTTGIVIVRGNALITNNSSAQVDTSGLIQPNRLNELWWINGLGVAIPLQVTDTSRTAGTISQTITDDGTTTTVQRI